MKNRLWWLAVLSLSVAVMVGCGDDSGDDGDTDAGPTDTAGSGGSGGSGGESGSTSTAGTGGTTTAAPVTCGDVTCPDPTMGLGAMAMGFLPVACCLDEATSTCGTSSMGGPCMGPPEPHPECDSFMTPAGEAPGCCLDNVCGFFDATLTMACTDYDTAGAFLSILGVSVPDERVPCDLGDAGSTDTDAGN
ncbi:MAG: hypothetical protein OEZ06_08275 [Myxococcales bacterium]|nr:hypothetical protein [Myxococcales bacterium]